MSHRITPLLSGHGGQSVSAVTVVTAAVAAVAVYLLTRPRATKEASLGHSMLTPTMHKPGYCECGASLAGLSAVEEREHRQSRRHLSNVRALQCSRIFVAENWAEYRRAISLVVKPQDCVLEVGCGRGVTTNLISEACSRVVGIDRSAKVIALARERFPLLEFYEEDAADVSSILRRGRFNKIFVDINGARELQTVLPLLESYDAVLKPEVIVVKNVRFKRLLLRTSLVDASLEALVAGADA